MRRVPVVLPLMILAGVMLAGCKGTPTPYLLPTPTPTATPPPTISPPDRALTDYTLAAQTTDDLFALLERAAAELIPPDQRQRADLAAQVEMTAREAHGRAAGLAERAQVAWRAALAFHRLGDVDRSLAWLRPAILEAASAGEILLQPPPFVFNRECVTVEVAATEDFDGDGAVEWLLWMRFDTPPHESASFVIEQQPDGAYTLLPAEGGWPQVGAGGTLLVETAEDINADGRPEMAISTYTCGDPGCAGELHVFGWRGDRFASLVRPPERAGTRGVPLRDARWAIVDSDMDGMIEINVVAPRLDTFGWGCRWDAVAVYEWDAAADAYVQAVDKTQVAEDDPACLMTQADWALEAGDYGAAAAHLSALLALPADQLGALGADFPAFVRFRLGVTYALASQPAQAQAEMEAARQTAFVSGLVDAFLENYRGGSTPQTACAVAAYYAVNDPPTYALNPVNVYGGLAPGSVCPGGHDAVQRLIQAGGWRTDAGPLRQQLEAAGVPLLSYVEANLDGDADPEAVALTKTDFPFLWLFDADASGDIAPKRIATAKRALSLRVFGHDIDGDAAPEAYILIEMRDPYTLRCVDMPTATVLRVEQPAPDGTLRNLLTATDCRTPADLEAALRADPATVTVFNNLGAAEPAVYTYRWMAGGYAQVEPPPVADATPAYAHPTGAERAQLNAARDVMLEQDDLARARSLLDALLALPPETTDPAFRAEARYLSALWHELSGSVDAAREGYYQLWVDAPGSPWGELARRKLKP